MKRTVATSWVDLTNSACTSSWIDAPFAARFDEDRQWIGIVGDDCCANHRTIVS